MSRSSRLGSPPALCLRFALSLFPFPFQGKSTLSIPHLRPGWLCCWEPWARDALVSTSRAELQVVSHSNPASVSEIQPAKQHINIIYIYYTCHYTSQSVTAVHRYFTVPMTCLHVLGSPTQRHFASQCQESKLQRLIVNLFLSPSHAHLHNTSNIFHQIKCFCSLEEYCEYKAR